jgi:hypothetical protein
MKVFVTGATGVPPECAGGAGAHRQLTGDGVNIHMHPYFINEIAEVRQHEMLADAERRRIARQLAKHARA